MEQRFFSLVILFSFAQTNQLPVTTTQNRNDQFFLLYLITFFQCFSEARIQTCDANSAQQWDNGAGYVSLILLLIGVIIIKYAEYFPSVG